MRGLSKMADMMWVNILTLLLCLPIVTGGAALTACHFVCLKIVRGEDAYITRTYFNSFKTNFKQSTVMWLLMLVVLVVLVADSYILKNAQVSGSTVIRIILMAFAILFVFFAVWVFPVQSKFVNTVKHTMKNAFALSAMKLPRTLLMIVIYLIPLVVDMLGNGGPVLLTADELASGEYMVMPLLPSADGGWWAYAMGKLFPIVLLFGIAGPVTLCAMVYNKTFKTLEDNILKREEEEGVTKPDLSEGDEHIFSDEPFTAPRSQLPEDVTPIPGRDLSTSMDEPVATITASDITASNITASNTSESNISASNISASTDEPDDTTVTLTDAQGEQDEQEG